MSTFNKELYWKRRKNRIAVRSKETGKMTTAAKPLRGQDGFSRVVAVHAGPDWLFKKPSKKALAKNTRRARRFHARQEENA